MRRSRCERRWLEGHSALRLAVWGLFAGFLAGVGCGQSNARHLVPNDQLARQALTTALEAWKENQPIDDELQLPRGPKIHVLDIDWRGGRKLEGYEIGQLLPSSGEEPRKFTVRLDCEGQEAKETIYHVVGQDPLWIFRDEDMRKTTGM